MCATNEDLNISPTMRPIYCRKRRTTDLKYPEAIFLAKRHFRSAACYMKQQKQRVQ